MLDHYKYIMKCSVMLPMVPPKLVPWTICGKFLLPWMVPHTKYSCHRWSPWTTYSAIVNPPDHRWSPMKLSGMPWMLKFKLVLFTTQLKSKFVYSQLVSWACWSQTIMQHAKCRLYESGHLKLAINLATCIESKRTLVLKSCIQNQP